MGTSRKWLAALVAGSVVSGVQAGDVSVSGFMSAGAGWVDDETVEGYAGYSEEDIVFEPDTLLGLQFKGQISEKMSATVQMVARGTQDYEATAEWVYVSYDVNDSFTWRAGRLRAPYYQYSDYLDVGYALPWIRAPREVYFLNTNNVDGVDALFRSTFGSVDSTVQLYFGAFDGETAGEIPVSSRNQMGAVWSLTAGSLSGRAAVHTATLTIDVLTNSSIAALYAGLVTMQSLGIDTSSNIEELTIEEETATYGNVAINYDNGSLLAGAEYATLDIDSSPYGTINRMSAILGWRFGDVLVHATLSEADDDARTDLDAGIPVLTSPPYPAPALALNAIAPGLDAVADSLMDTQSTITLGVRWDFTSSAALKFQLDDISYDKTDEEQTLYSVAIQTVF